MTKHGRRSWGRKEDDITIVGMLSPWRDSLCSNHGDAECEVMAGGSLSKRKRSSLGLFADSKVASDSSASYQTIVSEQPQNRVICVFLVNYVLLKSHSSAQP